jgi:hypothetical protein
MPPNPTRLAEQAAEAVDRLAVCLANDVHIGPDLARAAISCAVPHHRSR